MKHIWTIRTDDIDSIRRLAMGGNLIDVKLRFNILQWSWIYVAKYYPYL